MTKRRPLRHALALLLAAVVCAVAAPASAESLSQRFQEFLSSELYQLIITSKWDQQARIVCGTESGHSGLEPGYLAEVVEVRGENGIPTSGAWIHSVPGRACGRKRTFNILVEFGSEGPRALNLLPGKTLALPPLQRAVLEKARLICRTRYPECEWPIVVDTAQAGKLEGIPGGWVEVWLLDICGSPLAMTVNFTPDGQGGTVFVLH